MLVEVASGKTGMMPALPTNVKKIVVKPPIHGGKNGQHHQQIIVLPSNIIHHISNSTPGGMKLKQPAKIIVPASAIKRQYPATTATPPSSVKSESEVESEEAAVLDEQPARKRANLDHLTPEEKLMRRKLKNRVAAQNARDKKRVKMDEMEAKMKELEEINARLLNENDSLRALNERLMMDEKPSLIQINPTPKAAVTIQRPTITFSNDSYSHSSNLTPPPSEHAGSEASSEAEVDFCEDDLLNGHCKMAPSPAPSTASSLHSLGSASPPSSPSSDSDHSLVDSRPFDSAEIINASQQQSQGRGWAGLWTAVTAVTAATVLSTATAGATGTTAAMEAVCKMAADQCLTKTSSTLTSCWDELEDPEIASSLVPDLLPLKKRLLSAGGPPTTRPP